MFQENLFYDLGYQIMAVGYGRGILLEVFSLIGFRDVVLTSAGVEVQGVRQGFCVRRVYLVHLFHEVEDAGQIPGIAGNISGIYAQARQPGDLFNVFFIQCHIKRPGGLLVHVRFPLPSFRFLPGYVPWFYCNEAGDVFQYKQSVTKCLLAIAGIIPG